MQFQAALHLLRLLFCMFYCQTGQSQIKFSNDKDQQWSRGPGPIQYLTYMLKKIQKIKNNTRIMPINCKLKLIQFYNYSTTINAIIVQ